MDIIREARARRAGNRYRKWLMIGSRARAGGDRVGERGLGAPQWLQGACESNMIVVTVTKV